MRSLAQSFNFPHFGRAQISLRTRTSRISGCHLVPEKRANDQVDQARVVLFTPSPPSSSVFFFFALFAVCSYPECGENSSYRLFFNSEEFGLNHIFRRPLNSVSNHCFFFPDPAKISLAPLLFSTAVNNAGIGAFTVVECTPMALAKEMFEANYFGALRLIQAVLPNMKARQRGHIINNGSTMGVVGTPFNELYCSTKFAIEGLTEALAPTLLHFNIR